MTQEEKELLFKDLCARLPYGVKFESYDNIPIVECCVCDNVFIHEQGYIIIELLDKDSNGNTLASISINLTTVSRLPKPYLRPMSSMTQEEIDEYDAELDKDMDIVMNGSLDKDRHITSDGKHTFSKNFVTHFGIDWLNKNMFDYRGLIPMGLALEAKEGMYKNE